MAVLSAVYNTGVLNLRLMRRTHSLHEIPLLLEDAREISLPFSDNKLFMISDAALAEKTRELSSPRHAELKPAVASVRLPCFALGISISTRRFRSSISSSIWSTVAG